MKKIHATDLKTNRRNTKIAICFLLPNILGFLIFTVIPVIQSAVMSLFDWPTFGERKFIGFHNYINLFSSDPLFLRVLGNTAVYVLFYVSLNVILALAVWVTNGMKGSQLYRSIFFLPQVTPIVATAMIWKWLFLPQYGIINNTLSIFGIPEINWLGDMKTAMSAIVIMSLWQGFGYNMVIFIAGLNNVPSSQLEAARIDGANKGQIFFKVTLPLISPYIFFGVVMTVISSFQVFDQTLIMTNGGPANATNTIVLYLYNNAFTYLKLGYASAMAWILFAIIMFFTILQMRMQKDLVVYE
ncbi:sugar ABC transporter permease [uncultured Sphaerochaeta sp.]|uniref:carbohydrate ABC transporter permease n=1 Tax=uncultured Sphaerochaeta sp. TaxID=886478 RepID=UPI002A0A633F|nr:sugar ABC transporter permease [uncultured Sphaerochaeta sp.]